MRPHVASAAFLWAVACNPGAPPPETAPELQEQIIQLYERARESGEAVSGDVYEWAREDVERIGDWEYRIVRHDDAGDAAIEAALNELGSERWEVVWIDRQSGTLRLFLKRPRRSFLRHLPLSELPRLVPGLGE